MKYLNNNDRLQKQRYLKNSRMHFYNIADYIVSKIKSQGNGEVTLIDLLDDVKIKLNSSYKGNLHLLLLSVKGELEFKKIIKTNINSNRIQNIRLSRGHKKKINTLLIQP